jgi:hypothetical protein
MGVPFGLDTSNNGSGFDDTGDWILKFDANGMGGTNATGVCYVVYDDNEDNHVVQIPGGAPGAGLKIYIRHKSTPTWTEL